CRGDTRADRSAYALPAEARLPSGASPLGVALHPPCDSHSSPVWHHPREGCMGLRGPSGPFPVLLAPLGGPSSHHLLCGWCMMLFLWRTSCRGEVSPSAHTEPRRAPCTRALWCRAHSNSTCRKHAREVLGEGQDAIVSADDQMVCRMTGHATCHPC